MCSKGKAYPLGGACVEGNANGFEFGELSFHNFTVHNSHVLLVCSFSFGAGLCEGALMYNTNCVSLWWFI